MFSDNIDFSIDLKKIFVTNWLKVLSMMNIKMRIRIDYREGISNRDFQSHPRQPLSGNEDYLKGREGDGKAFPTPPTLIATLQILSHYFFTLLFLMFCLCPCVPVEKIGLL